MKQFSLIIIIIAVLLIGVVIGGFIGMVSFAKPPSVSVTGASFNSINLSAIDLAITFTTENTYPVAIPIKSLNYTVSYQGKAETVLLGKGDQTGIAIKPGKQDLVIPLIISNPALIRSVLEMVTTGNINLIISGNLTPDLFGIAPPIPFSKEVSVQVTQGDIISKIGSIAGGLLQSK